MTSQTIKGTVQKYTIGRPGDYNESTHSVLIDDQWYRVGKFLRSNQLYYVGDTAEFTVKPYGKTLCVDWKSLGGTDKAGRKISCTIRQVANYRWKAGRAVDGRVKNPPRSRTERGN